MDFLLSPEQLQLKAAVQKFIQKEILPSSGKKKGIKEKIGSLREEGLWEESTANELNFTLLLEEISRVDPALGLWLLNHRSFCLPQVHMFGSRLQKKRFEERWRSGQGLAAWEIPIDFLGESDAHLRAEKKGKHWFLRGKKLFLDDISIANAVVMTAKTEPHKGKKGHSVFILEDKKKEGEGIKLRRDGLWEMVVENVQVSEENMIGEAGNAYAQTAKITQEALVSLAAMALGLTEGALDSLLIRGEKIKNSTVQKVEQRKAAYGITDLEACRFLTYRTAFQKDQKKGTPEEADSVKSMTGGLAWKYSLQALQSLKPQESFENGGFLQSDSFSSEEEKREIQRYLIAWKVYGIQKS